LPRIDTVSSQQKIEGEFLKVVPSMPAVALDWKRKYEVPATIPQLDRLQTISSLELPIADKMERKLIRP
jgi:hypothetical protein